MLAERPHVCLSVLTPLLWQTQPVQALTPLLASARPSPAHSLIKTVIANMTAIKCNTKPLLVMNCFHFHVLDPKPHILGILAYCDTSFKTNRDRNLNPVKFFQIQNFISPIWCYLQIRTGERRTSNTQEEMVPVLKILQYKDQIQQADTKICWQLQHFSNTWRKRSHVKKKQKNKTGETICYSFKLK